MAASILDVVAVQLEVVSPNVENYVATTSVMGDIIKKAEKSVTVSRYLYRKPIKLNMGGVSMKISANGGTAGAFPQGTGMQATYLTGAYFPGMRSYQITDEEIDTTSSAGQAVLNVLSEQIADAMEGAAQDEDIQLHTSGNGVLTNPGSASADTTHITFAGTTDYLRVGLLRDGMAVDVWDTTLATKRATATTAPTTITIDRTTNIVTFSQVVTGLQATDRLVWPNVEIFGPATPTSFSSTFPLTGVAAGIGGDSFRHGYYYANDATTSNYLYGRLKSSFPQFLSNRINAASNAISWSHGRLGMDAIIERFQSAEDLDKLVGFAHPAQIKAIEDLNLQLNTIMLNNGEKVTQVADRAAFIRKLGTATPYCGMNVYKDARQRRDRVDFINTEHIERCQLYATEFQDGGDGAGKYLYRCRASNGQPTTAQEFYVRSAFDWLWSAPGKNFFIDTLLVPTGY